MPDIEITAALTEAAQQHPKQQVKTFINRSLPQRLCALLLDEQLAIKELARINSSEIEQLTKSLKRWTVTPAGTEGYRTAEVTRGGVDCDAISSKTMEVGTAPGLFFIGEVLDVTGWLGGYNLQWAWSSGWCAGQYV